MFNTNTKAWQVQHPSPTAGEWHHVVMTWRDQTAVTSKLALWWDGVNVATDNSSTSRNVPTTIYNDFLIGRPNNNFHSYGEAVIDELIFWDKELEDARIMSLWESYNDNLNFANTTIDQ
ncbi:unnamed protein product [Owenia fusiformis]|uniref:Uncharacterized protein n=1 Tax=Owenia fusiformis TaxID=6347 RepID=A0A8S4PW21_OWEFU|nr:unnamed protein product [Owenia fusiformis]